MSKYSKELGKELNDMYDDAVNKGLVEPSKEIELKGKVEIFEVTNKYRKKLEEEMPENSLLIKENVIYIKPKDGKLFKFGFDANQYNPKSIVTHLQNDLSLEPFNKEGLEGTLFRLGDYEISLNDINSILENSKKNNPSINKKRRISEYFDTVRDEGPIDVESLRRETDYNETKPRRTIYGIDVISKD